MSITKYKDCHNLKFMFNILSTLGYQRVSENNLTSFCIFIVIVLVSSGCYNRTP